MWGNIFDLFRPNEQMYVWHWKSNKITIVNIQDQ